MSEVGCYQILMDHGGAFGAGVALYRSRAGADRPAPWEFKVSSPPGGAALCAA